MGVFLVSENCISRGPLGRSLRFFACTTHSLTPQRSPSLCSLAPFTGSLTCFAHSLVGELEFFDMRSCCKCVQWKQSSLLLSLETRSKCSPTRNLREELNELYIMNFHQRIVLLEKREIERGSKLGR